MNGYYMKFIDNRLVEVNEAHRKIPPHVAFIHSQFRALILSPQFPCSGSKTAFNQGTYRFGVFNEFGTSVSAKNLAQNLSHFVKERPQIGGEFTTFIASFLGGVPSNPSEFTHLLWEQLQFIHEFDELEWDSSVSSDPESPEFSFSIGGCAFFVIGMHAASPRWARRFAWPTLVFNAHDQFEKLREKGDFERFKQLIRKKDTELQGSHNPILEDHRKSSEAVQYSGEVLDKEWKCPFKHKLLLSK